MIPVPMPIILHSSDSGVEYAYPQFVMVVLYFGLTMAFVGAIGLLAYMMSDIVFDKWIDDKWFKIPVALLLSGMIVVIVGAILMIFTGTPIE